MQWNKDARKPAGGYWYCTVKRREADRRHYTQNREKLLEAVRRYGWKRYGIDGMTEELYEGLLEAQGGVCLGCGITQEEYLERTGKRLGVDHDHETGEIRGILCTHCNLEDVLKVVA